MIDHRMSAISTLSAVYPLGSRVNEQGRLEIGGCDTVELAYEFGTPAYVVAEDDLRWRARAFLDALAARHTDYDVLFASKAFPCTAVYRVLAEEGLACDVASGGELASLCAAASIRRGSTSTATPSRWRSCATALDAGVGHIVIDSLHELERLERVVAGLGRRQEVLIRVTPGVAGDTHHAISTGQADSKFGFALARRARRSTRLAGAPHLELVGLHFHIGSQLLELEPFARRSRTIAALGEFEVYNLGGGLGVAYTADQQPPAIADYIDAIVDAAHDELGPDKRLLLEPGRALVANSTVTLYTVETVKRNVSTWVAVDGGMSDNLRPMLYGSRYEAADRRPAAGCRRRAAASWRASTASRAM